MKVFYQPPNTLQDNKYFDNGSQVCWYQKLPLLVSILRLKLCKVAVTVACFFEARVDFSKTNLIFFSKPLSLQAFRNNGALQRPGSQTAADGPHGRSHVPCLWEADGGHLHGDGAEERTQAVRHLLLQNAERCSRWGFPSFCGKKSDSFLALSTVNFTLSGFKSI